MSPFTPEGDLMGQIATILSRLVIGLFTWLEAALPIILPASLAAYLYGKHFGYSGPALKLFVATGVFASVIGTPVVLQVVGLDIEIWRTAICCGIAVFCYRGVIWAESVIRQKLGIDRRKNDERE